MAVVTPTAKAQFIDAAGVPLAGGFLYTYAAGTTTPQATYTDSTGATANSNPIVLDSRGEANIWLGSSTYKFKLTDADNTEIWTVDNISAPTTSLSPILSGNVVIDTNSSGTALTINQAGNGALIKSVDTVTPSTVYFTVTNIGHIGINTASPGSEIDIAGGGLQISSSGGTARSKVYADATNSYYTAEGARAAVITANSVNLIYADSSGNVGIKNASPAVALDVTGAMNTSGNITGGAAVSSTTTLTAGSSLNVTTSASIGTTLSVDTIAEKTSSAGVTVNNTLKADTISGKTSANTVTLAGIAITSSQIPAANRLITAATAQASTSGTSIPFTSIPSWVKRITVLLNGVSLTTTDSIAIQIGTSSGYETSGYVGAFTNTAAGLATSGANFSSNFTLFSGSAASNTFSGSVTLCLLGSNSWIISGVIGWSGSFITSQLGGYKSLSGTLDRLQVIATGGAFDAGSINILYE